MGTSCPTGERRPEGAHAPDRLTVHQTGLFIPAVSVANNPSSIPSEARIHTPVSSFQQKLIKYQTS